MVSLKLQENEDRLQRSALKVSETNEELRSVTL